MLRKIEHSVLDEQIHRRYPTWEEMATFPIWDGSEENKRELLRVLDRAADDPAFIAQLTDQGYEALEGYNLTWREKAALMTGDIAWIEAHVGKLDERRCTWLWCRLQQENW